MANSATIDELREQHEAAILRLETKQLLAAAGMPLVEGEAWGDYVDRREYLTDDPSFTRTSGMVYYTNISDRTDGRFRPIYETEVDLSRIRGAVRNLYSLTPILTGAQDSLANYVLGTGMQFGAKPADESDLQAAVVAGKVQEIIDRFCDDTDFAGVVDREAHNRSREDGEAFLRLVVEQGQIGVEFLEADQVTEPAAPRELEGWLGCGEQFPSCWKFGVHTAHGNPSKPLGYHVVRDGVGNDWDYVEADRLEHIKRNVTRNAKRGVSDFYPVLGDLEREAKLRKNMVQGAALQAAIAWIQQGAAGQTSTQLSNLGSADRLLQYSRKAGPGGNDKIQNVNNFPAGSILRVGFGQEYKPGPMGAERNAGFELVAQYALRAIGVRWNMPEYLISGDASNGNYASSMVAEAPFVKAREADQQFYKRHFLSLLWKVVKIHFDSGRLSRFGLTWDQIKQIVRLEATAQVVANRDPAQQADTHDKQLRNGMISMQTAREQAGLDHTQEETRGAVKEQPPVSPFGMPGANPFEQMPESFQESADTDKDGRWITMNGEHVFVNSNGYIAKGPAHLRGKKAEGGEPVRQVALKHAKHPSEIKDLHKHTAEELNLWMNAGPGRKWMISHPEGTMSAAADLSELWDASKQQAKKDLHSETNSSGVPDIPEGGFKTEKGSIYKFGNGRSQRYKVQHAGHESGDVGYKTPSDKTVFVEPDHAKEIGAHNSLNRESRRSVKIEGNHIVLRAYLGVGPNGEPYHNLSEKRIPFQEHPEMGKAPVEFWNDGSNHPGNAIVEMRKKSMADIAKKAFGIPDKIAGAIDTAGNAVADFSRKHMESTTLAAVTAALESVETTHEARGVLAQLTEVYP